MGWRYGEGGWVEIHGEEMEGLPGRVYVRFTRTESGDLRLTELYIDGDGQPIEAGALRAFPLGRAEQAIRAFSPETLEHSIGRAGPDLSTLASYADGASLPRKCGTDAYWNGRPIDEAKLDWVMLSFLAQLGAEVNGRAVLRPAHRRRPRASDAQELTLHDPVDGLTDAFLADLARAYSAALSRGPHVAKAIAEIPTIHASVRTVHSWIAQARDRGFIPPANRKKVTSAKH